jgi:propionyl-CoA carboxylase alpha chain
VSAVRITSVLVANRGEIAVRVMRTASEMGVSTVAVYVTADAHAPHVAAADRAIRIPAYLDGPAIIDAALRAGADAVHPGYGFLSENADFARSVAKAGVTWIGPSPESIAVMGDKLAAKQLAERAGVPTLPQTSSPSEAARIGFPLLVKAAAGGGGKGMRVVRSAAELDVAMAAARREAAGAFGDDTVFLERFIERARHIEVQVLGDTLGTVVHLGERECSIQRRHQKIIEEAPSPAVDADLRERLGEAALRLCRELGYVSAGTVEFIVEDDGTFWFLEANTRLQVEHPVTEAVTGIDIVRQQIRIARGEPLDLPPVTITGHAVEARLYAEDPANGFLPTTGTLARWRPATDPPVRYDSGIAQGAVVGIDFDPMLAKVIASAPTRSEAAGKLARALERTRIAGITTNRDFLVAALRTPEFLAGDTTTDFVDRVRVAPDVDPEAPLRAAAAAALWTLAGVSGSAAPVLGFLGPGWRNSVGFTQALEYRHGDELIRCELGADGTVVVRAGAGPVANGAVAVPGRVAVLRGRDGDTVTFELDGELISVELTGTGDRVAVHLPAGDVELQVEPRFPLPPSEAAGGGLLAPMPGTVVSVDTAAGGEVRAGQVLVVLEAMKMEHHVVAAEAGTVAEISVRVGDQVERGAVLLRLVTE